MGNNIWERRQRFVFFRIPNLCFSTLASPEILVFLRTYEILMIINHFPLLSHRIVGGCINHFVKKKIDHSAFIVGVCSIALSQVQHCVYNRLLNEPTLLTSKVQLETLYRRVDLGGGSGGSDPSPPLPLPSDLWVSLLPVRNRTSPLNLKYSERADPKILRGYLVSRKREILRFRNKV